jgi:hypothetical protein
MYIQYVKEHTKRLTVNGAGDVPARRQTEGEIVWLEEIPFVSQSSRKGNLR